MTFTPLEQIEKAEDGQVILAVQGQVKFADKIKRGTSAKGNDWSLQGFVLTDGRTDVRCTLWDANEQNSVHKGQTVSFSAQKNKKGQWSGILKKIDQGKYHKLEIRAEQVTWADEHGVQTIEESGGGATYHKTPPARNNAPVASENPEDGILAAKRHLMQSCSLYVLAIKAVETIVIPEVPEVYLTPETWDSIVGRLHTGAHVQGFAKGLPARPLKEEESPDDF